jgi:F-type H+-transporting ATPase subunit a
MNALKRIIRWAIYIGLFLLLCGILPRLFPVVLPQLSVVAEPVACIGGDLEHHCEGGFAIRNSMVATVIVDVVLIAIFLIVGRRPKLVPAGLQNFFDAIIEILFGQAEQVAGKNASRIFPVGATIFLFVFFANYMELLPGVDTVGFVRSAEGTQQGYELDPSTPPGSPIVFLNTRCPVITEEEYARLDEAEKQARVEAGCQEPIPAGEAEGEGEHAAEGEPVNGWVVVPTVRTATTDINVTLALALVAFTATQAYGIRNHMPHGQTGVRAVWIGTRRYLSKFFNTSGFKREGAGKIFGAIDFFAGLLEALGEFGRDESFTFRLFGNIFAGTVLIFVLMSLVPYILPVAPLLLETFVGLIQAYVFMMLTFVFMHVAAQVHGEAGH